MPGFFRDAYDKPVATAGYLGSMFTIIAASYRIPIGIISDKIHFMDGGIFMEAICMTKVVVGTFYRIGQSTFLLREKKKKKG